MTCGTAVLDLLRNYCAVPMLCCAVQELERFGSDGPLIRANLDQVDRLPAILRTLQVRRLPTSASHIHNTVRHVMIDDARLPVLVAGWSIPPLPPYALYEPQLKCTAHTVDRLRCFF